VWTWRHWSCKLGVLNGQEKAVNEISCQNAIFIQKIKSFKNNKE
jgi:hypothetical protein